MTSRYKLFYKDFEDDLGHYFRLLYHLYKMIDEKCPSGEEQKYYYAQLVRAHLSTSELFLLAYNCICGEGRHKFVSLIAKFAVLHNIEFGNNRFEKAEELFIRQLPENAFKSWSEINAAVQGAATAPITHASTAPVIP